MVRITEKKTQIFLTWLPLALMWLIMAVEQPVVTAVIARKNDAVQQLAAFGLAFSLALFIEGPVVQMLAAGTAVATNRLNYNRILTMMHVLGISATIIQAILCIPVIFIAFARVLLGIPELLIEPTRLTLLTMLPWTFGVGYRRLWQGLLIRYGKSSVIPVTMLVRMLISFAVLFWGLSKTSVPGALLGGLALTAGVIGGALTALIYAAPVIQSLQIKKTDDSVMSWRDLITFYVPLALTNFMNLGARPLLQMGMARGVMALESLAAWPIVMGYIFLYKAFSLSSQEVVIALLKGPESWKKLLRFSSLLAAVLGSVYLLVLITPLWRLWFTSVSGLSESLTSLSRIPVILTIAMIPLSALISLYRGALVCLRRTKEVSYAVGINVIVLVGVLFAGVRFFSFPAITITAMSYTLAYSAEFIYLLSRKPVVKDNE